MSSNIRCVAAADSCVACFSIGSRSSISAILNPCSPFISGTADKSVASKAKKTCANLSLSRNWRRGAPPKRHFVN